MKYIIIYIIVSFIVCFIISILLIKGSLLLWNNLKSHNVRLSFTIKNIFMIFIPATLVLWVWVTIFILANLEMH